jgi:flagellar export protein FliJ
MNNTIKTLQQLKQIRQQAVSQLTTELAKQKQLCSRYQQNIQALTLLNNESKVNGAPNATLLSNCSSYKNHLQRVIDWQKQEHALADKTAQTMQSHLVQEACREKTVELVLDEQLDVEKLTKDRQQQKITDGLSTQCWLRHRQLE